MRYFLTGRQPPPSAILLVESGSRGLLEGLIGGLRRTWGPDFYIDLVTCYATPPRGFDTGCTRIYRVSDYRGRRRRRQLYRELARNGYSQMGIVCSGEPLMPKWKWALALRLPAKVFAINENGDYFWLDRKHLSDHPPVRASARRPGRARARFALLARLFSFPFTWPTDTLCSGGSRAKSAARG